MLEAIRRMLSDQSTGNPDSEIRDAAWEAHEAIRKLQELGLDIRPQLVYKA